MKYGKFIRDNKIGLKKRLGQHFMVDPSLLRSIASAMVPCKDPVVLEVGAGIGSLTRELSALASHVYAVEIDEELIPAFKQTCLGLANVTLFVADILKTDLTGQCLFEKHDGHKLVLCGNLPYYATSEILYSALVKRPYWNNISVVIQEEVGKRITGKAGTKEFGRLSLWCQYRSEVKIERIIPKGAFIPPPEVSSCLVSMKSRPEFPLTTEEEILLDRIARAAFSQRRKKLLNSLLDFHNNREELMDLLYKSGFDYQVRPEDLGVEGFVVLTQVMKNLCRRK